MPTPVTRPSSPLASTSASRPHMSASSSLSDRDRLYGQKELAEVCERHISTLFDLAPSSLSVGGILTPPPSPPGKSPLPPVLIEFIAYALYRTRLPVAIVHQALLLLERLKARYPSARGTASSPHRLFLAALMLASKMAMDDTYSNKSWAIVGGNCFALREVNQMERELFAFLGCNVHVGADEVEAFQRRLEQPSPSSSSSSLPASASSCSMPPTPPLSPVESQSSSSAGGRSTTKRRRAPSSDEVDRAQRAADAAVALLRPLGSHGDQRAASRQPPSFLLGQRSPWSSSSGSSGASTPASPHPATPPHNVGMGIMAPRPSVHWPTPGGKVMVPPPQHHHPYAHWGPAVMAPPQPPPSAFAYRHPGAEHGWA